jgi:RES domain-containing protein
VTVLAWRIGTDTPAYTADDLSGAGAKITGGRWNRDGVPVIYTASSPALACLETVVHLVAGALPLNRYLVRIDIPDEVFARRLQFEDIAPGAARVGWTPSPRAGESGTWRRLAGRVPFCHPGGAFGDCAGRSQFSDQSGPSRCGGTDGHEVAAL